MASSEFWWLELSSLILSETGILSLIKIIYSGLIIFGKVIIVFDEMPYSRVGTELVVLLLT